MAALPWQVQTVENQEETNIEKVEVNAEKRQNAEKLAEEVLHLEALLKAKKDELKGMVKEIGPVTAGDVEFRMVPSFGWKGDTGKLFKTLIKQGINPIQFFTFGAAEAKNLFKETDWNEDSLKGLGFVYEKSSESFRGVKIGGKKK
jgi:hypothetical protein